jgi:glycine/D-amino acid oxidase-like deaminating enzyme/nitrite reductase/ring-hydroxylating ferredoxin subunit
MAGKSIWAASAAVPEFPPLGADLRVDVCVVGAGIAGLTTAHLLAQSGKSVAVLDDGPIGAGMSQMTTGHLVNMMDDRYFELERLHGAQASRLAAESHSAAIDCIESIVASERIDCDFARLDGFLFLAQGDAEETLDKELAAAHRAGLGSVAKLVRAPFSSFDTGPCLRFPKLAQFDVMKYLSGLAKAICARGGHIFNGSHAEDIDTGSPARVRCGKHRVTADAVVVATNVPINDRLAIHTKQAPYTTYVIGARVPRGSVPKLLSWDTGDPYHYIRVHSSGNDDFLIVGGEDHKSGQADDADERHARLEAWARSRFPMMGPLEFAWGGQVMETVDYLAFIGRNPADRDNVYVATGDSGMGLTHGTIAGMLLSDLILGRKNPWADLYDPSRKTIRSAVDYARENLNVARQYADWLSGGEVKSADEIPRDSGAIMRRGLSKIAAYRDTDGSLHERHAACPHLGCVVQWNGSEKTWDCPCHGSRFDRFGMVINGPANRALSRLQSGRVGYWPIAVAVVALGAFALFIRRWAARQRP